MPARNGMDYLKGLQDDREVWLDDVRITDVTTPIPTCGVALRPLPPSMISNRLRIHMTS